MLIGVNCVLLCSVAVLMLKLMSGLVYSRKVLSVNYFFVESLPQVCLEDFYCMQNLIILLV